jgi:hypothetical protein
VGVRLTVGGEVGEPVTVATAWWVGTWLESAISGEVGRSTGVTDEPHPARHSASNAENNTILPIEP